VLRSPQCANNSIPTHASCAEIDGTPLDRLHNISQAVQGAALETLSSLHKTAGFVHGDLHLGNILLKACPNDTAACCIIDFGRSRFNATLEEQQRELEALKSKLC
jgi:tRNA A-37 threonylcarbamoyl transferase component Bud32